ncbi:MAG: hypothetical protein ACHQ1G_00630 [Planctomycetota bacterium]
MKRWAVLLAVVALAALVWLATAGGIGRSSRPTPRAEGTNRAASSEGASGVGDVPAAASLLPPVDLEAVDRDRDLHGIVVRKADGAPIAGAELQVVTYPWRRGGGLHGYDEAVEGPLTQSASDGTFSLRLVPGTEVALRVRASGYATLQLPARQPGERVRVEMDAGARLTIVTRDDRGNPVPGTALRLFRGQAPDLRGVTDEQGRCVLGTVPSPAVYTVDVVPARLGYHSWETLHLIRAGEHEHEVILVEGRTITGVVTDAETGAAIPGARIGMGWVMTPFVTSRADGRYELPGWIGKGVDDVHCLADGYGRAQWIVLGDVRDFALARGDSVTGRLLGADGRPVGGAPVSTVGSVRNDDTKGLCVRAGRSDTDGRFLISGLRRDTPHTLIVTAEGHGRYLLDFDPFPEKPGTIDLGDLTLPGPRAIAGRVLTYARERAPRVEVDLFGYNPDRTRLRDGAKVDFDFRGAEETRRTDDLGRFRFGDLSPGAYVLTMKGGGEGRRLALPTDQDLLDVELVLPDGRELTVTCVDEEGGPVAMVFVGGNQTTDAMGRATIFVTGKMTRIDAYPEASGRDLLHTYIELEDGTSEYRIVLRKASTIQGFVRGEDGKPVGDVIVAAKVGGKSVASELSGADGAFTLRVPMDETFDVQFDGLNRRGRGAREEYVGDPVRARSGATGVEVRLRRLARDRALRVKVVFPDGSPAPGITVHADKSRADTGDDGVATLTGLPAREVVVNALAPMDRADVAVPAALKVVPTGQEVTLALRKALAVSGVVMMPDGTPAAHAFVMVQRADRVTYAAEAAADGTFAVRVPADEAGPWTVYAAARDKKSRGEAKDVRTGDAGVRIELK